MANWLISARTTVVGDEANEERIAVIHQQHVHCSQVNSEPTKARIGFIGRCIQRREGVGLILPD